MQKWPHLYPGLPASNAVGGACLPRSHLTRGNLCPLWTQQHPELASHPPSPQGHPPRPHRVPSLEADFMGTPQGATSLRSTTSAPSSPGPSASYFSARKATAAWTQEVPCSVSSLRTDRDRSSACQFAVPLRPHPRLKPSPQQVVRAEVQLWDPTPSPCLLPSALCPRTCLSVSNSTFS